MPEFNSRAGMASTIPPEVLVQMQQREMQQRLGGLGVAGHAMMAQAEGVLAARVAELAEEVRELRRMLAPPSAVILTGPDVVAAFRRLADEGGDRG